MTGELAAGPGGVRPRHRSAPQGLSCGLYPAGPRTKLVLPTKPFLPDPPRRRTAGNRSGIAASVRHTPELQACLAPAALRPAEEEAAAPRLRGAWCEVSREGGSSRAFPAKGLLTARNILQEGPRPVTSGRRELLSADHQ